LPTIWNNQPQAEVTVSLHGSLETFALPDVLTLLSSTRKSGELRVVGSRIDGRVWVDNGKVVGSEVGRSTTIVDAVFELLRLAEGTFSFESDRAAPSPGDPVTIEPILAEAQSRLREWRLIEAVVPSLEVVVKMAEQAPDTEVTLRAEQWRILAAAGDGRTVSGLMDRLTMCEFDACRAVKELVEAHLAALEDPATAVAEEPAAPTPVETETPRPEGSGGSGAPDDQPSGDPSSGGSHREDMTRLVGQMRGITGAGESDIDSLVEIPSRFRRHQATASAEGVTADAGPHGDDQGALLVAAPPELTDEVGTEQADSQLAAGSGGPGTVDGTRLAAAGAMADDPGREPHSGDQLDEDGEEPINRGLLLKFLSSVRS
jgi:hypothetical protein